MSNLKLKSKGRKEKFDNAQSYLADDGIADEANCINPTFKIKPGTKRVGGKSSPAVPVPEIQLTFNFNDLGLAQKSIKLDDLSSVTKIKKKRKAVLKQVSTSEVTEAKESWVKKKGKDLKFSKLESFSLHFCLTIISS